MGKDLHYTIRPFIEKALNNHKAVKRIEPVENDDFFVYKIYRTRGMSEITLVLSDDYYFGSISYQNKPNILKNGGFFLIARPEASGIEGNKPFEKLSIGKLSRLMGALNRDDFWNYEPVE